MFSDGISEFSPGKIYDYIALNRRIWLCPPDGGHLKTFISENDLGNVFNSVEEIYDGIVEISEKFGKNQTNTFQIENRETFSREASTAILSERIKHLFSSNQDED